MCIRDRVSVIIKVISHELGIILDDDAQLFGTGDEIPDLLAGLAQGLSLIHILVCFVLSDTIHIKGGPHSWAAFVCLEKQTEIYEKGGME